MTRLQAEVSDTKIRPYLKAVRIHYESEGTTTPDVSAILCLTTKCNLYFRHDDLLRLIDRSLCRDIREESKWKTEKHVCIRFQFERDTAYANDISHTTIIHPDLWINNIMSLIIQSGFNSNKHIMKLFHHVVQFVYFFCR